MKTKLCKKCNKICPISNFRQHNTSRDGLLYNCNTCQKKLDKIYYNKNKGRFLTKRKIYRHLNKEKIHDWNENYRMNYPWLSSYYEARKRCTTKNHNRYHRYGGRGIKCLISKDEIKELWFRDKAWLLKKPSIDRIDNDGHYEYGNCRFIELGENSKKGSK